MSVTRARWRLALNVIVSLVLLALLTTRIDLSDTTVLMLAADRPTLAVAALLFLGSHVLGAMQWRKLLQASGLRIPAGRVLASYFQGAFFGLFLPANVGGDLSRVYDTSREEGTLGGAIAATVTDRLVGLTSIGLMALVALVLQPSDLPPAAILLPTLGFAGVNLVVSLALFSRRVSAFMTRQAWRIPKQALRDGVTRLISTLHTFGRQPRLMASVGALSICVQILRIGVHAMVAAAMGIHLDLRSFFVIVPVLAVIVALPISFGGIGVREAAAIQLFGHVGVPPSEAVGMQVLAFFVSIAVSLPGWIVFLMRQARLRSERGR
jgi:uncharacterized protein (TIRG00374 family)